MEKEEITHEILTHEKTLNSEILKAAKHEEESLRIKSRQLWLKGGAKIPGNSINKPRLERYTTSLMS